MDIIFLIEDDQDLRELYGAFLAKELGCQIMMFQDGLEAITYLDKIKDTQLNTFTQFNLTAVVSDYSMPKKSGGDVWKYIQDNFPEVAFMIFTSKQFSEMPEFNEKFLAPNRCFIRKPITPNQLSNELKKLLAA